jgi:ADP-heptose:LPS heptosyltransferase
VSGQVQCFAFFSGQEDCHACSYYLRCIGVQEIRCPSFSVGEKEARWLDKYWTACNWYPSSKILVVHPGSGGKKKCWEIKGFAEVVRWWSGKKNCHALILLGPAEDQEEEKWKKYGRVEKTLSLLQVAAILSRADLYLGNDSGISHLAGAVGARGVVLFGPTNPRYWRPLGGCLSVVRNDSYRAAMPQVSGVSLMELPAEQVIGELMRHYEIRRLPVSM